eukprot:g41258.t1
MSAGFLNPAHWKRLSDPKLKWLIIAGGALIGVGAFYVHRLRLEGSEGNLDPADPEQFPRWLASKRKHAKRWVWLESNPPVMNVYLRSLGVKDHVLVDVFGTEPDLLAMVEGPVRAVLLLFPHHINEKKAETKGSALPEEAKHVWHTYQYVRGACGSIGLLHAIMNNLDTVKLDREKFYDKFAKSSAALASSERAQLFYDNAEVEKVHKATAMSEGTSQDTAYSKEQNLHFNAFVHVAGLLWELDGLKQGPVCHGATTAETLLQDAVAVIQREFMQQDPENINFTMMALVPAAAEPSSSVTAAPAHVATAASAQQSVAVASVASSSQAMANAEDEDNEEESESSEEDDESDSSDSDGVEEF